MAEITITIKDKPEGGVSVVSNPSFSKMMEIDISGHEITSAHGYAFSCLNHIRNISKSQSPIIRHIPKLGRH